MPVTRLGEGGYGVRRYGSFAGKTPDLSGAQHPVGIITRLALDGYGVRRYRTFSGKASEIVTVTATTTTNLAAGLVSKSAQGPRRGEYVNISDILERQNLNRKLEDTNAVEDAGTGEKTPEAVASLSSEVLENLLATATPGMALAPNLAEAVKAHLLRKKQREDEAIALLLLFP